MCFSFNSAKLSGWQKFRNKVVFYGLETAVSTNIQFMWALAILLMLSVSQCDLVMHFRQPKSHQALSFYLVCYNSVLCPDVQEMEAAG